MKLNGLSTLALDIDLPDIILTGDTVHDVPHGNLRRSAGDTSLPTDSLLRNDRDADAELPDVTLSGDAHVGTSTDTPLRPDAFDLPEEEKMRIIREHFRGIMQTLGLDLNDDSLGGTPHRVAKMFVHEIFHGLDPKNKPVAKVFENKFAYGEMLVERNIAVHTTCEHHFLPIVGHAHVAYISTGTVIGLSKINRIVDYYARRPQVQERLTRQISEEIKRVLCTEDVAVIVDAHHFCVSARGIQDDHSSTLTSEYAGRFREDAVRREFLQYVRMTPGH
jgi:GTP cyclohydrolase IA